MPVRQNVARVHLRLLTGPVCLDMLADRHTDTLFPIGLFRIHAAVVNYRYR